MTYPCLLGAIVITSSNNRLRLKEDVTTYNVDLTPGVYFLRGGGGSDDFCQLLATALSAAAAGGNSYSCTTDVTINTSGYCGIVGINRAAGVLDWSLIRDGTQTFDYDLLGYSATTAHSAGLKLSDTNPSAIWASNDAYKKLTRRSRRVVGQAMTASGRASQVSRSDRIQEYELGLAFVINSRLFIEEAYTSNIGNTLESFIDRFNAGSTIEIHDLEVYSGTTLIDTSTSTRIATVQFSEDTLSEFDPVLIGMGINLYDVTLTFIKKV